MTNADLTLWWSQTSNRRGTSKMLLRIWLTIASFQRSICSRFSIKYPKQKMASRKQLSQHHSACLSLWRWPLVFDEVLQDLDAVFSRNKLKERTFRIPSFWSSSMQVCHCGHCVDTRSWGSFWKMQVQPSDAVLIMHAPVGIKIYFVWQRTVCNIQQRSLFPPLSWVFRFLRVERL